MAALRTTLYALRHSRQWYCLPSFALLLLAKAAMGLTVLQPPQCLVFIVNLVRGGWTIKPTSCGSDPLCSQVYTNPRKCYCFSALAISWMACLRLTLLTESHALQSPYNPSLLFLLLENCVLFLISWQTWHLLCETGIISFLSFNLELPFELLHPKHIKLTSPSGQC